MRPLLGLDWDSMRGGFFTDTAYLWRGVPVKPGFGFDWTLFTLSFFCDLKSAACQKTNPKGDKREADKGDSLFTTKSC